MPVVDRAPVKLCKSLRRDGSSSCSTHLPTHLRSAESSLAVRRRLLAVGRMNRRASPPLSHGQGAGAAEGQLPVPATVGPVRTKYRRIHRRQSSDGVLRALVEVRGTCINEIESISAIW